MRDVEVLVAPGLESGVVGVAVLVAGVFEGGVEVDGVFLEEVVGSEIGSSSEPGGDRFGEILVVVDFEVADVEVALRTGRGKEREMRSGFECDKEEEKVRIKTNGGSERVVGMKNDGETDDGVRERLGFCGEKINRERREGQMEKRRIRERRAKNELSTCSRPAWSARI